MAVQTNSIEQGAVVSWSGGKDSCYAAILAKQQGIEPKVLLNVLNEQGEISRSHGIPSNILQAQANAMGLPIHMIASSWKDYEQNFVQSLQSLTSSHQLTHAVFGDIDLQAHRDWEEMVCSKASLTAVLPLWLGDRKQLVMQMLQSGIETMIVSCNTTMGERYLGQQLTMDVVNELEQIGIDPCGENGEFHTLVINCSLFSSSIKVKATEKILHDNYWFSKLELV